MSEYIFVTNLFEYSNIRIYSSHSGPDTNQKRDGDSNDEVDGAEWWEGIVTAAVPRENFC